MDTELRKFKAAVNRTLTKSIRKTVEKAWDEGRAFEREACAKLVEEQKGIYLNAHTSTDIAQKIAEAIRNRV